MSLELQKELTLQEALTIVMLDKKAFYFKNQYEEFCVFLSLEYPKTMQIKSEKYRQYLRVYIKDYAQKLIKKRLLEELVDFIASELSMKRDLPTIHLEPRIVKKENAIYYDLCDDKSQVVVITTNGWTIETQNEPLFEKYRNQKSQVSPSKTYDPKVFEKALSLWNLKDEDAKLLTKCRLVAYFFPNIPRAINITYGPPGSSKTTSNRFEKSLIDPGKADVLSMHNNKQEIIQALAHNYVCCFDNLTYLQTWQSDLLCSAVTGLGFTKRMLWTNDDDYIYSIRRAILLNGIGVVAEKADLLNRSILTEKEQLFFPRSETDIVEEFEALKPELLGYIFDTVSKVLKQLEQKPNLGINTRMADFATISELAARSMGHKEGKFIELYLKNIDLQNEEAIESNPVAELILVLMQKQQDQEWIGSPTKLLTQLRAIAIEESMDKVISEKSFPTNAKTLGRKIREMVPNLRLRGYDIEFPRGSTERLYKIRRKTE
jgi:hypothetical protein